MEIKVNSSPQSVCAYHQDGSNISVASIDKIEEGKWWISRVNVKEVNRGKGIGSVLLKKCIESVLLYGSVDIIVAPGGYGADEKKQFNFYKKNGFIETKEEGLLIYKK